MSADQWFGAAIIAGAIVTIVVFRRESRLRREASPVVPLGDLLHEQDCAEAYDDLPERPFRTTPGSRVVSRAEYEAMEPEPGIWYWICDFYDADGDRLGDQDDDYDDADREQDIEQVRAWLREMVIAHTAREESDEKAIEREWFDLSHDARTGGAS